VIVINYHSRPIAHVYESYASIYANGRVDHSMSALSAIQHIGGVRNQAYCFSSVNGQHANICKSKQVYSCVQLPTYADNVALPALELRTPLLPQSIDIFCPPDPLANLQQRVCCCGPMLGQTDGQTDSRTDIVVPY